MYVDLSDAAVEWLDAPDPTVAFASWLGEQDDTVRAGFAALGTFDAPPAQRDEAVRRVARHRERILELVRARQWRRELDLGLERALLALGGTGPNVRVHTLVGSGNADASGGGWRETGSAFLWLENWLGPGATGELQDRPLRLFAPSVAHEIGHAVRYALPNTASPLAQPRIEHIGDVWPRRLALPLGEVMYEEGMCTAFGRVAFPELSLEDALGLGRDALDWLEQNWLRLVRDRKRRLSFEQPDPPIAWLRDAVFFDPRRRTPPWSIEHPPTKWGYYVGYRWASAARGDWMTRLGSPSRHSVL